MAMEEIKKRMLKILHITEGLAYPNYAVHLTQIINIFMTKLSN